METHLAKVHAEKEADAFRAGHLLSHEVTPHVRAAAAALEANRHKADAAIKKQDSLVTMRLKPVHRNPKSWQHVSPCHTVEHCLGVSVKREPCHCQVTVADIKGKKLFLADGMDRGAVAKRLAVLGAAAVEQRLMADALIVDDPAQPGSRNLWSAVFCGQLLVSQRLFFTGSGPAVQYRSIVSITSKRVFLTPAFRTAHPLVAQFLTVALRRPDSKWQLVGFGGCGVGRLSVVPDRADDGRSKATIGPTRLLRVCRPIAHVTASTGLCGI